MSLIKEPKGIDFIIQNQPLIYLDRKEISNFIKSRKAINKIENKLKTKKKQ